MKYITCINPKNDNVSDKYHLRCDAFVTVCGLCYNNKDKILNDPLPGTTLCKRCEMGKDNFFINNI